MKKLTKRNAGEKDRVESAEFGWWLTEHRNDDCGDEETSSRSYAPILVSSSTSRGDNFPKMSRTSGDILALVNSRPRRLVTPDLTSSGSNCERFNVDFLGNPETERGVENLLETEERPEIVLQNLRGRIEHVEETNRTIFEEITSLRKNFQCAEKKIGNLTTETTRLRREIRDLRYLDDLVNLLSGELERMSNRNWPFNLGHTDHRTEEVNLVV